MKTRSIQPTVWFRARTIVIIAGSLLISSASFAQPPLSLPVTTSNGNGIAPDSEWIRGPAERVFAIPAKGRSLAFRVRLGEKDVPLTMAVRDAKGKPVTRMSLVVSDPLDAAIKVDIRYPDKSRFRRPFFVKPDLKFYVSSARAARFNMQLADRTAFEERNRVAAKIHQFPPASQHELRVRFEWLHDTARLGIWLDERFVGSTDASSGFSEGWLSAQQPAAISAASDHPALDRDAYLVLDLDPYGRAGALPVSSLPGELVAESINTIAGIPIRTVAPGKNINVGLSRWLEETIDPPDFCDTDTTRSAFDGTPESIILRVPKDNYFRAHLLCALDTDEDCDPLLTIRLTRFGNHSGDSGGRTDRAIADTQIRLPRDPSSDDVSDNVTFLGQVMVPEVVPMVHRWTTKEKTLRVFMVSAPLEIGTVADLLGDDAPTFGRRSDYWNIELTRAVRTTVQFFNLQAYRRKPVGLPSGVHVLGLTLERAPVDVHVSSTQKGNIFAGDETPVLETEFVNRLDSPTSVSLAARITDFYGKTTLREETVNLPPRGTAQTQLDLHMDRLGHFNALISATCSGEEIWRQPTSFALLPRDTRTAGEESPFGVWWFYGTHGCCNRLDWLGPILQKAGIRHCCPGPLSAKEMAPYQLSYSMAPSLRRRPGKVQELLEKNPNIRFGMIFHERGIPGTRAIFPELLGQPAPELTDRGQAVFTQYWAHAEEAATWYRQNHPDMKISFGNSPPGISAWFMRKGWPTKWVDCFAMEGVGAWHMPEGPPRRGGLQEVWFLSEIRKIYGYEDVPVSSGYEYITRGSQPGALTERQQGEYHTRDAIHCLVYGYPSINIGLADDCADSYYSTIYGGSGFVHRNPLLTPKPGYVMFATMTRLLDRAQYSRALDTGSHSLYALEFKRGNRFVYPAWTLRGSREVRVTFIGDPPELIDSMGNPVPAKVSNDTLTFSVGTTPVYLSTAKPLENASAGHARYEEQPPDTAAVIHPLEHLSEVTIDTDPDTYLDTYADDLPYTRGKFEVQAVKDTERGAVLELELLPAPAAPKLVARYIGLEPAEPLALKEEATAVGLWIKGNSCWGRVFWEFVDARGERYFSASDETSGWDVSDWKNRSAINFDGWCYVSLPVPRRYPGGFHGPTDRDWRYVGGNRDGIVQHPITVTRLVIAMRDHQVVLTDMVPSRSRTLRISDLTVETAR